MIAELSKGKVVLIDINNGRRPAVIVEKNDDGSFDCLITVGEAFAKEHEHVEIDQSERDLRNMFIVGIKHKLKPENIVMSLYDLSSEDMDRITEKLL